MTATKREKVTVDAGRRYQLIDGFGVNINSKYWQNGRLQSVVDKLIDDLGATLFRVDLYGKSNWVDPEGSGSRSLLTNDTYERVYSGGVFEQGWQLMRHLNERGIQPYLTASGDVPPWMLGEDGRTLQDFDSFAETMTSLISWAKKREKLQFHLFGPLNETDIGSPEGPSLQPEGYAEAMRRLVGALDAAGLTDVRFVVAEQAHLNTEYARALLAETALKSKIEVVGVHTYFDHTESDYRKVAEFAGSSGSGMPRVWMTEYGDLDETGEREWYVAWVSTRRLLTFLSAGFQGALVWDAYDNYHDHDEAWTLYGLLRMGRNVYTPKKRYYAAKQVYRFVPPGYARVDTACESASPLKCLSFTNSKSDEVTIVGLNESLEAVLTDIELVNFDPTLEQRFVSYYRTSETDNCAHVGSVPVRTRNYPLDHICVEIPPKSIFTITSLRADE